MEYTRKYYERISRNRRRVILLFGIPLFIFCLSCIYDYLGVRTSVVEKDYKVVRAILSGNLPESLEITRAYVKHFKRSFLGFGGGPLSAEFQAYYEINIDPKDLLEVLKRIEYSERGYDKTILKVYSIDWENIERCLSCYSGPVLNHLYLYKDKKHPRFYIKTYGVDYPGFWEGIEEFVEYNSKKYGNGGHS